MADAELGKAHVSIFPTMSGFRSKVNKEVQGATKSASSTFKRGFAGAGRESGKSLGATFKSAFTVATKGTSDAALAPLRQGVAKATAEMSKARMRMADDAGKVRVAEMRLADAIAKSGEGSTQAVAADERLASARRRLATSTAQYQSSVDKLNSAESALNKAQTAMPAKLGVMGRAFQRAGTMAGTAFNGMKAAGLAAFSRLPLFAQRAMRSVGGHIGSAIGKVGPMMSGALSAIGSGLASIGPMVAVGLGGALAAIATIASALTGIGVSAYANYEQLVGGVDTLFKESSSIVQEYAEQAYKTSGLSANAYMEQVTGFSASLLKSLGGDTAKAAGYADQAVRDMSDNASKFGTDIQRIQDAYQGFAKQNYTMLDNLKLGYGGTKTEMERLIADANRVKQANGEMADLSIDSFADVTEAIHIIQTEMGITGTTAQEAATTISGSIASAKASFSNWVTEMGKDNGNIVESTNQLVDAIAVAASNLLPRIVTVTSNMFTTLATNAAAWLQNDLPVLLGQFSAWVDANLPTLIQKGMDMLGGIANGIIQNLPQIITVAAQVVATVGSTILQNLPQMLKGGLEMMGNLAIGFIQAVPQLVGKIPGIVQQIFNGFLSIDWGKVGRNIVDGIKNGLMGAAQSLVNAAIELGGKALDGIKGVLGIKSPSRVFRDQVGKMIPAGISVGIERGTPSMLTTASASARKLVGGFAAAASAAPAVRASAAAATARGGGIVQNFTFNHPVETPYEFARAIRLRERAGLAAQI